MSCEGDVEVLKEKTDFQNLPGQPFFFSIKQSAQPNPAKEPFWYKNGHDCMEINHIGNLFKQAFMSVGDDVKAEKIMATSGRKNLLQTGADLYVGHRPNTWDILCTQFWNPLPPL